jgi:Cyclic nucleotide-binding domain
LQVNQDAKKMLYLLSLFAESALIPKSRLSIFSGIEKDRESPLNVPTEDAFYLLNELNLIDILEDDKSIRTHPLLRQYVLEKLQQNKEYQETDLKVKSIVNLKGAYYDDFASLVEEYLKRANDIDSIREDLGTALVWAKEFTLLFPKLTPAQISRIAVHGHIRAIQPGEVLVEQGESAVPFFVVVSGEIEIVRPSGAAETLITIHGPGEFTGEVNMLSGRRTLVRMRAG